jgi:hypothetical protein
MPGVDVDGRIAHFLGVSWGAEQQEIYWETPVGLAEFDTLHDILCSSRTNGIAIAELRHTFDQRHAAALQMLADNTVMELHCSSGAIDGAADDNMLSTVAAFRRSANCAKGLCSIHRRRVLVSRRGSTSLNSRSEATSETAIRLLRTAHNELNSDRPKLITGYFRFMPMSFDDVPCVLHNASNLSQPEVPRHLFLSPPNGLYASITNGSPTSMFKILWGRTHECLVFKGILVPRGGTMVHGTHLTSNENMHRLAIIQTVDCTKHRDIVQKEFQVELNVTPWLSSNATAPRLQKRCTKMDVRIFADVRGCTNFWWFWGGRAAIFLAFA